MASDLLSKRDAIQKKSLSFQHKLILQTDEEAKLLNP